MNKFIISLSCLILAGCGLNTYQPPLSEQPKDAAKFESDRKLCIEEAKQRVRNASTPGRALTVGALGLVGAAATAAAAGEEDDYTKSPLTMTDECLIKKGYKLAK